MILKVSHNITAGNMVTSFEGVRVSRYAMPMSTGAAAIYTRDAEDKKSDKSDKNGGDNRKNGSQTEGTPKLGGEDVKGNPNTKIHDTIDFDESNVTEMKPIICICPAHGPKTDKALEWEWSSRVVDKMVEILKGYTYADGTQYNVQRCNKGGNYTTSSGYKTTEIRTLVKKYGSRKVISLVPHWNGSGGNYFSALKGGKDDVTREDSIKLMECISACANEVKKRVSEFTTLPEGAMNGECTVELFPSRKEKDKQTGKEYWVHKSTDGATMQKCACALTENWFADYPRGCLWKNNDYNDLDENGRYKTMRGWLESDIGIEVISKMNADGIKKYIDYINDNGLVTVSSLNETPKANYEGKTLEEYIKEGKMVDVTTIGGSSQNIMVDIRYSTSNNIFGGNIYGDLRKAYLEPNFANKVVKAQEALESHNATANTNYTLIIWDAVRPNSIQIKAYQDPKTWPSGEYGKKGERSIFVRPKDFTCPDGNIGDGSLHSYGVAVDLSIYDKNTNTLLDMGTDIDDKTNKAKAKSLPKDIGETAYANRQLLFKVMKAANLIYTNEWWHFQEGFAGKADSKRSKSSGYYVK
jgi:D-alanyl-D-alanine dipeptidase